MRFQINIKLCLLYVLLLMSVFVNAQNTTETQQLNARATGYAIVASRNPGKNISIIVIPWDGINTLEYNANNQINSGWHAQAVIKGNYFDQVFDGSNFTSYSSVILNQAEFDLYKHTGTQWWIVCAHLIPPFSNSGITISDNQNVGIGTTSPIVKLDVNGSINMPDGQNLTWGGYYGPGIPTIAASAGAGINFYPTGSILNSTMKIAPNGNVLIGKTSQSNTAYKLDVAGKARANEIVVNTNGADFVFEKNYKLRSLTEVETFIKQNKHLPEMANAKTMQADGIGVSEMQTKLLQKVEELTLYLIEQNKRIAAHQEIQEKQQKEIAQLKALLSKK